MHGGYVIGPTTSGDRTTFSQSLLPRACLMLQSTHWCPRTVPVLPMICGNQQCIPTSEISMPRTKHGSLTGPPPVLQFPAGFLEASGMKSILSTGPSTRYGSGSSISWTPTSWTPAASLSRSSISMASTSAA